ncbi:PQQ-dependent sugar dehydrogenase [Verrucomicrobiales bacterium BCK34]|nr:PQQ-dependent sugar dehydrogenase [Verrucomicrobiales bacterium BCK34]
MISALTTFLSQAFLFALSLLMGVVCYMGTKKIATQKQLEVELPLVSGSEVIHDSMVINASAHLLAKTHQPVDIAGDVLGNFYVLQKNGDIIRISPSGAGMTVSTGYAKLASANTASDIGFSAISLHPQFHVKNSPGYGKFYVVGAETAGSGDADFTPEFGNDGEDHQDVIYEYQTVDPLLGNFKGTSREVVRFSQPGAENNVESIAFDHLGQLYIGVGDGSSHEVTHTSPSKNASSLTSAYGKVLCINPLGNNSANGQYGIPETNPFRRVSDSVPELWAFGLRNPHSLHFDPFQGCLNIGDTGIDGTEEINVSRLGGEHFGWDLSETSALFDRSLRAQLKDIVTNPAITTKTGRANGNVIYRGENFPALAGRIIMTNENGQVLCGNSKTGMKYDSSVSQVKVPGLGDRPLAGLKTTLDGELIVLCEDGSIFEIRKAASLGTEKRANRQLFCQLDETIPAKG